MSASQIMLFIQLRVISGIVSTDKISLRPLIIKATTHDLFYLTLMKIDTGSEFSQACALLKLGKVAYSISLLSEKQPSARNKVKPYALTSMYKIYSDLCDKAASGN